MLDEKDENRSSGYDRGYNAQCLAEPWTLLQLAFSSSAKCGGRTWQFFFA
jgi:hypothetical protein